MLTFFDFSPSGTAAQKILLILLDTTIKGSVILLLTGFLLLCIKRMSAHLRHQLYFYAIFSFLIIPITSAWTHLAGFTDTSLEESTSHPRDRSSQMKPIQGDAIFSQNHSFASYTFEAVGKFKDARYVPPQPALASASTPYLIKGFEGIRWLIWIWLGGTLIFLARMATRLYCLLRLVKHGRRIVDPMIVVQLKSVSAELGVKWKVRLLENEKVAAPMVWGPPWPFIFLPRHLQVAKANEIRMVLVHELAHLQRRDSLSALVAELVCSLFWFNPFVWKAKQNLQNEQENAADSHVLTRKVKPSEYSVYLMQLVGRHSTKLRSLQNSVGISAMLGRKQLESRLSSILSAKTHHRRPSRLVTCAVALLFLSCLTPISKLQTGLLANAKVSYFAQAALNSLSSKLHIEPVDSLLTTASLDRIINPVFVNKMADFYVAGAAISIVKDGGILYSKGFGRAEVFKNKPVIPERTIFRIGSVTKVATAIAMLQLVDRGLIDLEDDVNKYLTKFKIDDTFPEPVRVKHLLTHTAGFDQLGYGRHVNERSEVLPLGEFLEDNLVRVRPPGEVSCYDTYAITLAGYLVEQISGQSYETYITEQIFEPLEMYRTNIVVPNVLEPDLAVGYEFRGEWFPQRWEFMNTDPASTVNSTVTDMANFMIMLLQGGEFKGKRILSEKSAAEMLKQQYTNHPLVPGYSYTLWENKKYGVIMFRHGGSMTGYTCSLNLIPEHNMGIFIAYNQESGRLVNEVLTALISSLFPESEAVRSRRKPKLETAVNIERFTGTYANNMYNHSRPELGGWRRQPFELKADEDGHLVFDGGPCYPVGDLVFQRDDGLILAFRENDRGDITHLFVRQTVYEKLPNEAM